VRIVGFVVTLMNDGLTLEQVLSSPAGNYTYADGIRCVGIVVGWLIIRFHSSCFPLFIHWSCKNDQMLE
jgi:hypothetical protein